MARELAGMLSAKGLRLGIVASRFNGFIVERLVEGAIDAFVRTGGSAEQVIVARCPGAFEIAGTAARLAATGAVDALVCLGCVIRGATPHFDYVAGEVGRGLGRLQLEAKVPVAFGVLTTDTIEQAVERAGTKAGNKGYDAAMAAIELASLYAQIGQLGSG